MEYDFSALNDKEFEKFARDILNRKFNMDLQDFKMGKDQGRDLRYSTSSKDDSTIVQVKHYVKSDFKLLYSKLAKEELPKIKVLSPDRYIIVTSLELSASQKDKIKKALSPFILTANDIFGREDLNKYLMEFPDIEKNWFKLWLSSAKVLQNILHAGILGRSAFFEKDIKKSIQLYVKIKNYHEAFNILQEHGYLLITGQPGVGKTTLAKIMVYELLANGYELIYIDDDIKDAEQVFNSSPDKKQLFYFDDFLGANYLELNNPKSSESALVNFLERVKQSQNKLLILTTRTIILKSALDRYEKFNRTRIDIARKEIELGDYNSYEKALILYNHLFYSDLNDQYKTEIFKNKNYWEIINHRNYNPRLIDFITNKHNLHGIEFNNYINFVKKNLENPEKIWLYAYEQQMSSEEKILLQSVFAVSTFNQVENIKRVFEDLLNYQREKFNYSQSPNPFKTACQKLLDGIIKKENNAHSKESTISFINPSINDFLINYLKLNEEEREKLLSASKYIEQFERYYESLFEYHLDNSYTSFLLQINPNSLKSFSTDSIHEICLKFYTLLTISVAIIDEICEKVDERVYDFVKNYMPSELSKISTSYFNQLIFRASEDGKVWKWVESNWDAIIFNLIEHHTYEDAFDEMIELFKHYYVDYESFLERYDNYERIQDAIAEYVDEVTSDWIDDEKTSVFSEEDFESFKDHISTLRDRFFRKYSVNDDYYDESSFFEDIDMYSLIKENDLRRKRNEKIKIKNEAPKLETDKSETELIDDLFS